MSIRDEEWAFVERIITPALHHSITPVDSRIEALGAGAVPEARAGRANGLGYRLASLNTVRDRFYMPREKVKGFWRTRFASPWTCMLSPKGSMRSSPCSSKSLAFMRVRCPLGKF